ncbi:cytochrome P450 [Micromonospora sp. R77]|uniref:cytochrome P450 n=1 Tax=Micromonospora sp. R77 TaxID=2925836 RepID=UPI001F61821F|nr:cytochrome P450 [Micromonospora sp. R77]MCI4061459.1 cytochrome P450 [Micromonospora sp. R77]
MAVKPPLVPNAKPIVGHAPGIFKDQLEFFSEAALTAPLSRLKIGWTDAYLIANHELLYHVLVNDAKKYDKGVQYERARALLGNGVLLAEGDFHFRQRRLMQPMFNKPSIDDYIDAMHQYSVAMVESWSDFGVVRLYPEFYRLATRVVIDTLFSTTMNDADVALVQSRMPVVISGMQKRGALPTKVFDALPTAEKRTFYTAIGELRALGDRLVERRLAADRASSDWADLIDVLANVDDETARRDNDRAQILNEFLTFLTAGSETTPSAMAWCCYLLARHPDVQEQLREKVTGLDVVAEGTAQALHRVPLLQAVVKESLRLYPPVWFLGRRTLAPTTLGGYALPTGSQVFYSVYTIQRDPAIYDDPDEFKPGRWLDGGKKYPRTAFLPFGAGVRNCIGEHFAWIETSITLVNVLQRYHLSLLPGQQVRPATMGSLVPAGDLPMRLESVVKR